MSQEFLASREHIERAATPLEHALAQIVAQFRGELLSEKRAIEAEIRAAQAELVVVRERIAIAHNDFIRWFAEVQQRKIDARGEPGKDGAQGERGLPGADGIAGAQGERGEAGQNGAPGERGEKGEAGERGHDGKDGAPGELGPQGADGIAGAAGERGERGEAGERGNDGGSGERGAEGPQGRDGRDGLPGVQGERGKDGREGIDGKDGLGFDDLVPIDDPDCYGVRAIRGGVVFKEFKWARPTLADFHCGPYRGGESYRRGQCATYGGSTFVCLRDTQAKPESDDWRLIVKHGLPGRNGKDGDRGPPGPIGRDGRDLTQMTGGGLKYG